MYLAYNLNPTWSVSAQNTLFIREFESHYVRLNVNYYQFIEELKVKTNISPYYGVNYYGLYYDSGIKLGVEKYLKSNFINAQLIPYYDSSIGWNLGYLFKYKQYLYKDISANIQYSNYPEFRIPEKRITLGLSLGSANIIVSPQLSIPINGDLRTSRILFSFSYFLALKKNIQNN